VTLPSSACLDGIDGVQRNGGGGGEGRDESNVFIALLRREGMPVL
jgi:hypothetical protein